jgi:serine/threonine-protein kinase ULK/ATG1
MITGTSHMTNTGRQTQSQTFFPSASSIMGANSVKPLPAESDSWHPSFVPNSRADRDNDVIIRLGDYEFTLDDDFMLGFGQYGNVYRGTDQRTGSDVAVKIMPKTKVQPMTGDVLQNEANFMRSIRHGNIVWFMDGFVSKVHFYIVMEFCNGGHLHDYMESMGKLPETTVRLFTHQIRSAMRELKDKNVIHRDLKPENILLSFDPMKAEDVLSCDPSLIVIKIADFGFAKHLKDGEVAHSVKGTPNYMAPEVLLDRPYDVKADLFAIGVILCECLTATRPYVADSTARLIWFYKEYDEERQWVTFPEDVSPLMCDFIRQLIRVDPNVRMNFDQFMAHAAGNIRKVQSEEEIVDQFLSEFTKEFEDYVKGLPALDEEQVVEQQEIIYGHMIWKLDAALKKEDLKPETMKRIEDEIDVKIKDAVVKIVLHRVEYLQLLMLRMDNLLMDYVRLMRKKIDAKPGMDEFEFEELHGETAAAFVSDWPDMGTRTVLHERLEEEHQVLWQQLQEENSKRQDRIYAFIADILVAHKAELDQRFKYTNPPKNTLQHEMKRLTASATRKFRDDGDVKLLTGHEFVTRTEQKLVKQLSIMNDSFIAKLQERKESALIKQKQQVVKKCFDAYAQSLTTRFRGCSMPTLVVFKKECGYLMNYQVQQLRSNTLMKACTERHIYEDELEAMVEELNAKWEAKMKKKRCDSELVKPQSPSLMDHINETRAFYVFFINYRMLAYRKGATEESRVREVHVCVRTDSLTLFVRAGKSWRNTSAKIELKTKLKEEYQKILLVYASKEAAGGSSDGPALTVTRSSGSNSLLESWSIGEVEKRMKQLFDVRMEQRKEGMGARYSDQWIRGRNEIVETILNDLKAKGIGDDDLLRVRLRMLRRNSTLNQRTLSE